MPQNRQLSTSWPADYPIYRRKSKGPAEIVRRPSLNGRRKLKASNLIRFGHIRLLFDSGALPPPKARINFPFLGLYFLELPNLPWPQGRKTLGRNFRFP